MRFSVFVSFLLVLVTEYQPSEGATCMFVSTCEPTVYTKESCDQTSHVCDCKEDYLPIRSGCGKKLGTSTISPPVGQSLQVMANKSFTLVCGPAIDGGVYEFFKNNMNLTSGVNGPQYEEKAPGTPAELSNFNYSCRVKVGELYSEKSLAVKIEVIGPDFSSVKPKIFVPVDKVFNMSTITLQCLDVPMGLEGNVKFKVNGTNILTASNVEVTSSNNGSSVSCLILDPADNKTEIANSSYGKLPGLTNVIDNVTVMIEGQVGQDTVVLNRNADDPMLVCVTSPPKEYLVKSTAYQWKRNGVIDDDPAILKSSYAFLESDNVTANYTCTVTYPGETTGIVSRNSIKVIINDSYLTPPQLSVSASKPLTGGRLILSCGNVSIPDVTYSWTKGNDIIPRQFDRVIQLDDLKDSDNGEYKCSITKNNFVATSPPVQVTAQSAIEKPVVTKVGENSKSADLSSGGSYTLNCHTESSTVGMNYTWLLNGTAKQEVTNTYTINSASTSDTGTYICKATFNTFPAAESDAFTVHIIAAGVSCTTDEKCSNLGIGYNGTCDNSVKRCTCSIYYIMKGEKCQIAIEKPMVMRVGTSSTNANSSDVSLGGSYTFNCTTSSSTVGMNYRWLVNGTNKQEVINTYTINTATYSDAGNYTCKAELNNLTSPESEKFLVKIVAPGFICTSDADCSKLGTGYTGKCDTSPKRCTCASHYIMKGETCASGAVTMLSSTLILVCAHVLSQLFTF